MYTHLPDPVEPGSLIPAAIILLVVFAFRIAPLLFSRNRPNAHLPLGAPRDYGFMGGAVCPRCQRPSPFSVLTFNFGIGTKLTRCAFCGHWAMVRRLSLAELRAAEAAELEHAPASAQSAADQTQKAVDDSRFMDQP